MRKWVEKYVVVWHPNGQKHPTFATFPRVLLAQAHLRRLRKKSGKRSGWIWDESRKCKVE